MKLNTLMFTAMAVIAVAVQPLYAVMVSQPAHAAGETVVTADNMQGWDKYGTAPSSFVVAAGAPLGAGALKLSATTDAEYSMHWHDADSPYPLASSLNVHYSTKRLAGPAHAAASYVLLIEPDGDTSTLESFYAVYEPAYNGGTNYDSWNTWQITAASNFWYSGAYGSRPAGAVNYTPLSNVLAAMPNATVTATVINFGSGNGGWASLVDNVKTANGTVYDFDVVVVATNVTTATPYTSLQDAIDAASAGDVIRLDRNITLTDDVDITKSLVIDGNGKTVTANFVKSGNDNNSAFSVFANDVTIKNVTLDGVDPAINMLHGINAYQVTNLLVDGVTVRNFRTGILYNGSTGTIQNVHTQNNAWHGINIDKEGANVNVLGTNTHTEAFNIYVDNDTVGVTVNAPAYEWSRSGLEGRSNDRVYRLKPVTQTPQTPTTPATPAANGNGEVPKTSAADGVNNTGSADDVVAVTAPAQTQPATTKDTTDVLGTDEAKGETLSIQDSKKEWSLINLLLVGATVVMSIVTLAGIRGSEGRAKQLRMLTVIPAIAALIALLIIEDFTASLGWVNGWTLLFIAALIAQLALLARSKPAND